MNDAAKAIAGYPPFGPRGDLAAKPRARWTMPDARNYFDWLMSVLPERVGALTTVLGLDPDGAPDDVLSSAGEQMARLLPLPGISTEGRLEHIVLRGHEVETHTGPLLTATGYALAADLGLLMGTMLRATCPDLRWEIVLRPKSDVDYRMPVLLPFGPVHMDPARVSATVALGVLGGSRPASAWCDVFRWWRARCEAP